MPQAPSERHHPPCRALGVRRLRLTAFRNYREQDLVFDGPVGRLIVLSGPNGAGKTNLLEAISYLSPGRGLRGARLGDISRRDISRQGECTPWAVAATIEGMQGRVAVGTGLQPGSTEDGAGGPAPDQRPNHRPDHRSDRRIARIDGQTARPAELGRHLSVIWLTPRMDRLFMEGASERRRFFDRLVLALHPEHGRRISAYERSLRERLRALGSGADPVWLSALERRIAENAVAIAAARIDVLDHLAGHLAAYAVPGFPDFSVSLSGEFEAMLRSHSALEVEDRIVATLEQGRRDDALRGRTGVGPHLTDLAVHNNDRGMSAALCSTGEQKALLIGLVLAHAVMLKSASGGQPILLLDEIAAHLDARRRQSLFDALTALDSQVWLTGTDFELFAGLGAGVTHLEVNEGCIQPATA